MLSMKFQREKSINNKTKYRALLKKHQTSTNGFNFFAWNFADGIRILKTNELLHSCLVFCAVLAQQLRFQTLDL